MIDWLCNVRHLSTLGTFKGIDPRNGGGPTSFFVEEFAIEGRQDGAFLEPAVGYSRCLMLRSNVDQHMMALPESLVELWLCGEVLSGQLPGMAAAIAHKTVLSDHRLVIRNPSRYRFAMSFVVFEVVMLSVLWWIVPAQWIVGVMVLLAFAGVWIHITRRRMLARRKEQMNQLLSLRPTMPSTGPESESMESLKTILKL